MDALFTFLPGLLIGNTLLVFFVLTGILLAGRSEHLLQYQPKEQVLYFLITGLLLVTSLFAIITNKGHTVLVGIPLVLILALFKFGKLSNIANSLSKAIYLFIGFCLLYTFNFFQHDFHNSETIIRGIDEPFYYFIAKLLGSQPQESYLTHFTLVDQSLNNHNLPNFYHYFDLWLFKIVINCSFFLDNDLYSYWLILKPLTLSIHFYVLFLLFSGYIKMNNRWGFVLAICAIYAIFIVPGVSALVNLNSFLFYPKFFYCLFLLWINYRFFTKNMDFNLFICFLSFSPIIIPLSVPFVLLSLTIAFIRTKKIQRRIPRDTLLLYAAVGVMALLFLSNITFQSDSGGAQQIGFYDRITNKTYIKRSIYYITRGYGVRIIYYAPILLIPILLYFTQKRSELIESLLSYKNFFIISGGYVVTGLFLAGIMHFNRENWQFLFQFVYPVFLFNVILIVKITTPIILAMRKLRFYLILPLSLILFYSIKGLTQYHFVPQDFALSKSIHLKNAIIIKGGNLNNHFLFGYLVNKKHLNMEYISNATFPFNGGLMYQINNRAIPVYISNFNLIDSSFYSVVSYQSLKKSPFYNYANQNERRTYEENAKAFIEANKIKAFFIENNLNYNAPINKRQYHVLEDTENIGKYYFHKDFFDLRNQPN